MSTADATTELNDLPGWDLTDLYPGRDSAELTEALAAVAVQAKSFSDKYAGKLSALSGDDLAAGIQAYEVMQETLGRIGSFAFLTYATDMADTEIGQFFQNMQESLNDVTTDLLFFTLELNRLEDDALQVLYDGSAKLSHYQPWVRDIRSYRPHQLDDEIEKLLHEKEVAGRSSWVRLFDETMAGLKFPFDDKMLSSEEILHLLSDKDRETRKKATESLGGVFAENVKLFSLITNTLAKDKDIEDRWRSFADPADSRHLANQVEGKVVDALSKAVQDAYPKLSHRYYSLKAKWMGNEDKLDYWDRNAPLPEDDDKLVTWPQAVDTVLNAYRAFSPELADLGQRFFDNNWIDAPVRPGKASGAFAHPTVPGAHPYLMLNYQGKSRDVMTLAHELGHGVHQILAGDQGTLMSDTPLTLAETASVFGEQLTFRAMLNNEDDPRRRRIMLANKVEDMLNTVVRQIAFYEFEKRVHAERKSGELTPERLGEIWMAVQRESLGPVLNFDDNYQHFWCYIPHFIHSPFYVYAYAFGDCLVNSLYAVYQDAEAGFQEKYFAMLRAGGTLQHKELLAPFGLDASDPAFWGRGLGMISDLIDQLEAADAAASQTTG
ncbi:MAG: M3 family oligoendopeptidase [Alphaproteobacteria bacterium]|jgi:oligoendopeptidase F|nr:M3 family oligoendopeptidase [Alphaproteobacteria bacterium]MBT4020077.1 M3 family oligoendopeptidase [Alphaproteobacteria bacterium]MBT5158147.1 M3 family oligoendopeptidase [Alphaproteobacteria bacterium]